MVAPPSPPPPPAPPAPQSLTPQKLSLAQAWPQAPQCALSVAKSTHRSEQHDSPAWQVPDCEFCSDWQGSAQVPAPHKRPGKHSPSLMQLAQL